MTSAPPRASSSATARPIPLELPVTTARSPASEAKVEESFKAYSPMRPTFVRKSRHTPATQLRDRRCDLSSYSDFTKNSRIRPARLAYHSTDQRVNLRFCHLSFEGRIPVPFCGECGVC